MTSNFRIERLLWADGYRFIAGVDEVGRGAIAGPIVSAAVILPEYYFIDIKDSKMLTPLKRERLFKKILSECICWSIFFLSSKLIDKMGLSSANIYTLEGALKRLKVKPQMVLTDYYDLKGKSCPVLALIKGDCRSATVAAASIVAKVIRDRVMEEYSGLYPQYQFDRNKGYGTREHLHAIQSSGLSPIHRISFKINNQV
jgi:ribonuclease HII